MDNISIEKPQAHYKYSFSHEVNKLESKIGAKVTKKTMKYIKKLSKLAKLCDVYEIPFKFYIENETSLREK